VDEIYYEIADHNRCFDFSILEYWCFNLIKMSLAKDNSMPTIFLYTTCHIEAKLSAIVVIIDNTMDITMQHVEM